MLLFYFHDLCARLLRFVGKLVTTPTGTDQITRPTSSQSAGNSTSGRAISKSVRMAFTQQQESRVGVAHVLFFSAKIFSMIVRVYNAESEKHRIPGTEWFQEGKQTL